MALQDYNQLIIERLEAVRDAADAGDAEEVGELLDALEENGFDDESLSELRENLDALEQVVAWVDDRLAEMRGEENPFADAAFDVDDAFLDVEDTGFRDIADDLDDDIDLLDGLDLASSSAIELVDEVDDLGDIDDLDDVEDPGDIDDLGDIDDGGFDLFADDSEPDDGAEESEAAGERSEGEASDEGSEGETSDEGSGGETSDADEAAAKAPESARKGPLLSGKFNVPDPKSLLARKKKEATLGELAGQALDESLPAEEEETSEAEKRKTRPNVTPEVKKKPPAGDEDSRPFDSGESKVRYAAGKEPPPPSHRLTATADLSGEMAVSPPEIEERESGGFRIGTPRDDATPFSPDYQSEESEELEFDLGFENPEEKRVSESGGATSESAAEASSPEPTDDGGFSFDDDDEFDFDLGFENPEQKRVAAESSAAASSEVASEAAEETATAEQQRDDASETKPRGDSEGEEAPRERIRTPLATEQDDMFFELAEALAAESSGVDVPYRGEPKLPTDVTETNPFAHDAPTGTAHSALESVVAAAQSNVATNMNAILLEARRLRSTGELEAAYDITKKILSRSDNPAAQELQDDIAAELEKSHVETIGDLDGTPELKVDMSEIADLDLDHRAGFILSQVDGLSTYHDLIELSGMSRLETLGVLADLVEHDLLETT